MNLAAMTLQECIDSYEKEGKTFEISDGAVVGFIEEKKNSTSEFFGENRCYLSGNT